MNVNPKTKEENLSVRLDEKTGAQLSALAGQRHCTKSQLIRDLLDKGLKSEGFRKDDERLYNMIVEALQSVTKPQVERLAAISAKATQIDAAAFFMLVYFCCALLPPTPDSAQTIDQIAAHARQLGIEYLKHRGTDDDLDAFIQSNAATMGKE